LSQWHNKDGRQHRRQDCEVPHSATVTDGQLLVTKNKLKKHTLIKRKIGYGFVKFFERLDQWISFPRLSISSLIVLWSSQSFKRHDGVENGPDQPPHACHWPVREHLCPYIIPTDKKQQTEIWEKGECCNNKKTICLCFQSRYVALPEICVLEQSNKHCVFYYVLTWCITSFQPQMKVIMWMWWQQIYLNLFIS